MFTKAQPNQKLETMIDRAYDELMEVGLSDESWHTAHRKLNALLELRDSPQKISPDTLALIGANLVGILIIITHEHVNVITTKAFSQLLRLR